jgi:hypothetical protein
MALHDTISRLAAEFASDENFGVHGPTENLSLAETLASKLQVVWPTDVTEFIRSYGAIQFGTQCLDFVPNEYFDGCVEWTEELRIKHPDVDHAVVVIHQDELVYFLLDTRSGQIHAWESFRPLTRQNFYRTFDSLEPFVLYLADLAR